MRYREEGGGDGSLANSRRRKKTQTSAQRTREKYDEKGFNREWKELASGSIPFGGVGTKNAPDPNLGELNGTGV